MRRKTIFLIILNFSMVILSAQSVRASIDTSEVYVGETFEYRIVIEGLTESNRPELPPIKGIESSYKGVSTSMISSFGSGGNSTNKSVTHSWSFTATESGQINIPSVTVEIEGNEYKTSSGTILVKNPENIEGFFLFLEIEKEEYWRGEPILLTIKWLFSTSVSSPDFTLPFLQSGDFEIESQEPPSGSDVYKILIGDIEVLSMQSAEIYMGKQYSTLSFQLKLIPLKTGFISLGPITLAFDRVERSGAFRSSYKSAVIPSNSVELFIKPLPDEAYEGIMLSKETLQISSSAVPQQVHIGDPLTYEIIIDGAVSPEEANLPLLDQITSFADDFKVPERKSSGKADESGKVIFSQIIRVKNPQTKEIPAWEIPYFNLTTGSVERALVPPVPLDVRETKVVTSADLESTGYENSGDDSNKVKNTLTSAESSLLFNYDLIEKTSGKMNLNLKISLILFPILIYCSLFIYRYRYQLLSQFHKIQKKDDELETLYKHFNRNKPHIVFDQMKRFIMEKYQIKEGFFTPDEMDVILTANGNDQEICQSFKELFCYLEKALYGSDQVKMIDQKTIDTFYSLSKELK